MAILTPFGRAASKHLGPRSSHLLTRLNASTPLLRVTYHGRTDHNQPMWPCKETAYRTAFSLKRAFATEASAPAKQPAARSKRTTTTKKSTKSTSTKKATGRKKAVKKTKAKPKKKPKAKPKPKPKKKVLSEKGVQRQATKARQTRIAELKKTALLDGPKKYPESAWAVFLTEMYAKELKGSKGNVADNIKVVSEKWHNITPEERERLNHTANQRKSQNKTAYQKWVAAHTPLEIKQANNARKQLGKLRKTSSGRIPASATIPIKDDRTVKLPRSAVIYFSQDRHASGDLKSVTLTESAKLISREWKELGSSDKQTYEEKAKQDQSRYIEEHTSVYGFAPKATKVKA